MRFFANGPSNVIPTPKILDNDSTSADKKSAFFLVVHTDQAVAELMAECPKCDAMTTSSVELVWRLRIVTGSECSLTMRLGHQDLTGFSRSTCRDQHSDRAADQRETRNRLPTARPASRS